MTKKRKPPAQPPRPRKRKAKRAPEPPPDAGSIDTAPGDPAAAEATRLGEAATDAGSTAWASTGAALHDLAIGSTATLAVEAAGQAEAGPAWRLRPGRVLADRWEIERFVGAGTSGAVYRARDRATGRAVAVKVLLAVGAHGLLRFKQEFRALADVEHAHIVRLEELVLSDLPFFVMQLVEGPRLEDWLSGEGKRSLGRVRAVYLQIARGLAALHERGLLHRDLKPSNVLITAQGHVRLTDFGMASYLAHLGEGRDDEGAVVGTPAYMSPEQAARLPLSPGSDLYALGSMLYETLCGEYPFADLPGVALLMAKQVAPPPPPSQILADRGRASGEPPSAGVSVEARATAEYAALEDLCLRLLARDAQQRPGMDEVQRVLIGGTSPARERGPAEPERVFVGRTRELGELSARLERALIDGHGGLLRLRGDSGSGKTALLDEWLDRLRDAAVAQCGSAAGARHDASAPTRPLPRVLRARCYERETVPYKGMDGAIDELARLLREDHDLLDRVDVRVGPSALARVFPVMQEHWPADLDPRIDPLELRDRAFDELRAVIQCVASDRGLVVVLDDMQWCDRDGAQLLSALARPPAPSGLLIVVAERERDSEGTATSSVLDRIAKDEQVPLEDLPLEPLSAQDAAILARARGATADAAEAIAQDTGGNPLFVCELARTIVSGAPGASALAPHATAAAARGLDALLGARIDALGAQPRALLEVVAVASRPVPQSLAWSIAGLAASEGWDSTMHLRGLQLARTDGGAPSDAIDVYHDRMRTVLMTGLDPRRLTALHTQFGARLREAGADAEQLLVHAEGANDLAEIATLSLELGVRALGALAFARAIELLRRALSVMDHDDARRTSTLIHLAEAYACDGRSTDAGRTYVLAAERSDAARTGVLLRKAGDQLMRGGRIDEGLSHLRRALEAVGQTIPASSLAALADLALQRWWVVRRGRGFRSRDEANVPPLELERIDATWAAATNLSSVSLVVGQDLQARHLRQALDAGEPRRVLRALAVETLYAATSGEPGADATQRIVAEIERARARFDDPYAQAIVALARGMAQVYRGRFVDAIDSLALADAILREECTAVQWELGTVRTFRLHAAYYLGRFDELDRVSRAGIEDALRRDDLHAEVMLRVAYAAVAALAAGDEPRAREEVARARERGRALLSVPTFRYVLMVTEARIERFSGRGVDACASFDRHWAAIRRSLMLTKQPIRIYSLLERATSTGLWSVQSRGLAARVRLGSARLDLLRVERERADWAEGLAALVDGALLGQEGKGGRAAERLTQAQATLARWDMPAFAAAAAFRASAHLKGSAARAGRASAEASLRACGIADPSRMVDMLAPPSTPRR